MDIIKGKVVYKLWDNINTDKILAGRYLTLTGDDELAEHCFEGHIKDWQEKVKPGDLLVAGKNFGCGSSREHAPISLKASGISAVLAESFGRIFYRNAIAVGLPVILVSEISSKIEQDDELEIDVNLGAIRNIRTNDKLQFDPFPDFIQRYLDEGGLSKFVRNRRNTE